MWCKLLSAVLLMLILILQPVIGLNGQSYSSAEKEHRLPEFEANQIAQAKRGGREPLQQLACELDYGTAVVQYHAIKKLGRVGGWFSVQSLSRLLEDNPLYTGGSSDSYGTFVPLQFQALQALPLTVPNPPVLHDRPLSLVNYSRELDAWRNWLKSNQNHLRKLEPTGVAIIEDQKTCREVLKDDLASSAYPKPKHAPRGRPQ